jgi:predicted methyltransferase
MRVILLILFVLLIGQLVVGYFLMMKRLDKYQISFIDDLHEKMIEKYNHIITDIFKEFEELFEKYQEIEREQFIHGQMLKKVYLNLHQLTYYS